MEKKPNKEISPEEFKKLVLSKITNPDSIPKGDWLPPEIIIEDINLDNSFPLEHLVFENIDLRKIRLTFKNCLLKGRYRFDNFNVRSLVFINTKIDNFELKNSNLTIFNYIQSTSYLFRIENTAFKQHCSISQRNIQSSIRLIKIDTGQLNLSNIESNSLTVSNSSAKKLTIHKGQFDNLILSNNNFELAHLHSPDNQSLQVNNTLKIINDTPGWKIGQLKLGPNFNTKTEIRGTEKHSFKIDNISISDTVFSENRITFDQIETNFIQLHGLINRSQMDWFNVSFKGEKPTFKISNSFLGETQLFNFKFSQEIKFIFRNSDIKSLSYNKVNFGDNLCKEDLDEQYELYKQLKHVASKNNDTINAVRFYSIESDSFLL